MTSNITPMPQNRNSTEYDDRLRAAAIALTVSHVIDDQIHRLEDVAKHLSGNAREAVQTYADEIRSFQADEMKPVAAVIEACAKIADEQDLQDKTNNGAAATRAAHYAATAIRALNVKTIND